MIRRLFWVAAGAAAGVYAVRRVQRTAESLAPANVAGSLAGGLRDLGDALREFAADVREGMSEREMELRTALGLDDDGAGATAPGAATDIRPADGERPSRR